jgi:hypothetical protein
MKNRCLGFIYAVIIWSFNCSRLNRADRLRSIPHLRAPLLLKPPVPRRRPPLLQNLACKHLGAFEVQPPPPPPPDRLARRRGAPLRFRAPLLSSPLLTQALISSASVLLCSPRGWRPPSAVPQAAGAGALHRVLLPSAGRAPLLSLPLLAQALISSALRASYSAHRGAGGLHRRFPRRQAQVASTGAHPVMQSSSPHACCRAPLLSPAPAPRYSIFVCFTYTLSKYIADGMIHWFRHSIFVLVV